VNVSSPTDSFLLWFVDHRGNIGMADDALNNAQARQDVLAAATGLAVTLVPYVPTISGNTTILRQTAVVAA